MKNSTPISDQKISSKHQKKKKSIKPEHPQNIVTLASQEPSVRVPLNAYPPQQPCLGPPPCALCPMSPRSSGHAMAQAMLYLCGAWPRTLLTFPPQRDLPHPFKLLWWPQDCGWPSLLSPDMLCWFCWGLVRMSSQCPACWAVTLSSRLPALAEILPTPAAPWHLGGIRKGNLLSLEATQIKDLLRALSDSLLVTSDTCGRTGKANLSFYILNF